MKYVQILYEEKTDDSQKKDSESPLPPVAEGDVLKLKSILGNQHFTQPPARYTEASLTKAPFGQADRRACRKTHFPNTVQPLQYQLH